MGEEHLRTAKSHWGLLRIGCFVFVRGVLGDALGPSVAML
jgi:hypothetical protein